jgi:hypothetical protein
MPDYPTLDKTWNFNVNQAISAQGSVLATAQNILYQNVVTLTGFSPGWQVRGSSNSLTASLLALSAAGPGTSWGGPSSVVYNTNGNAHSWIVLRNTALAPSATGVYPEILLACSYATSNYINVYISPSAGFTGGSTTQDPTAIDSVRLSQGGLPEINYGSPAANQAIALHAMMSSDGQCTRIWAYSAGVFQFGWIIDRLKNSVTSWTTPWLFDAEYLVGNYGHISKWLNIASSYGGSGRNPSNQLQFYWTGEGTGSGLIPVLYNAPNDLNSEYPMCPIGVWTPAGGTGATPAAGRHGMFYDLWWGAAAVPGGTGQLYAGAAPHAFLQLTEVIFPWNGSAAMNTS